MCELYIDCPLFTSQWAVFVEMLPSRAAELPFKTIALFFPPRTSYALLWTSANRQELKLG